ncbi:MAG: hypothetical protein ACKO5W_04380, partial [Crocinitomicaceae bacterium]
FPFSTSLALLYLQSLNARGDLRFQEELNRLAIRITDRTVLYTLVRQTEFEKAEELEIEPSVIPMEILKGGKTEVESEEDAKIESLDDQNQETDSPIDSSTEEIQVEDVASTEEIDEVELLIQAGAAQAGYIIENEKRLIDSEKKDELKSAKNEESNLNEQKQQVPLKKLVSTSDKNELTGEFSFTQWLNFTTETSQSVDEMEEKNPIIERIDRPKKEFYSPSKKAKESLDEQKMPVSETLAKIFELQGNFPKAIYVYEQLSLIYPEKKTYFASQIKQVKKKIN